jgi:G2/mitotic-specific cyclin-B, other
MRSILVDWLVEVHFKFRLQTPTLWLCVNIMDRYLTCRLLQRNKLQLLGVSSLLIACKFEEIFPPEVQDCVYITDRAYSKDEVLTMEKEILRTLDYQLCVPTGYTFLMRYLNLIHASEILKNLSFYYAERNLQEPDSLSVKPSLFAAAALYAALVQQAEHSSIHSHDTVNEDNDQISLWPDILIEESDYDEMDLLPIAKRIILHVSEEPVTTSLRRLVSTKKKYLNDKFLHIADFSLPTFTIQIRRQIQPLIE